MPLFSKVLEKINLFKYLAIKKWPTLSQWLRFFKILSKKEKKIFLSLFTITLISFVCFYLIFFFKNTNIVPAKGGIHIEGLVGQPRFINPVYANSEADRDLSELIFSGLMKFNNNLELVTDLAKSYTVSDDGKIYTFQLKDNLKWEDKKQITAEDVIFTIKALQNPDYKSPFRAAWVGIDIEKINDLEIMFSLKQPYAPFLENLTVKILPAHIWENVSSENFALESYNLRPIGSGPFKIKDVKQDKDNKITSITLIKNPLFNGSLPYLNEIKFLFFDNEKDMTRARLTGFSLNYQKDSNFKVNHILIPRYFAIFYNQSKSKVLADAKVREAISYGTDKKELVQKLSLKEENIVSSPILPNVFGFPNPSVLFDYNPEKAKEILTKDGFTFRDGEDIRKKDIERAFQFKSELKSGAQGSEVKELQKCLKGLGLFQEEPNAIFGEKTKLAVSAFQEKYSKDILEPQGLKQGTGAVSKSTRDKLNSICFASEQTMPLTITLATVDQTQLIDTANILKEQWKKIGLNLEIKTYPASQLEENIIKPREYEALLFGEVLGGIPDLLPFWHSSQKKDPGLNLSMYENKDIDRLLEDARKTPDQDIRSDKFNALQNTLLKESPAIFLYSPDYAYYLSKDIKGFDIKKVTLPSKRFSNIENWYIKTKRIWK